MIDFSLWIKTGFSQKSKGGEQDVEVVILLLGSTNSGGQFTNLPGKGSRRNNWNIVFSRH